MTLVAEGGRLTEPVDPDDGPQTSSLEWTDQFTGADQVLVELNDSGTLTIRDGFESGRVFAKPATGTTRMQAVEPALIENGSFDALTCSVSQAADGTCPLGCRTDIGDTNQGDTTGPWFLGPPNSVSTETYRTFFRNGGQQRRFAGKRARMGRRDYAYLKD